MQGILSSNFILPESKASIISKRLITLVTLAGRNFSCIFKSYITFPELCSIKHAEAHVSASGLSFIVSSFSSSMAAVSFVFSFSDWFDHT